jgi:hypothetical protein
MLCNPRTQENSYVMLGPVVALFTAWALLVDRHRWTAALLLAVCVGVGFHRAFSAAPNNYWLQPLVAVIFAGYLVYITLANRLLANSSLGGCPIVRPRPPSSGCS